MFDPTKPPATLPELAQRTFAAHTARPYLGEKDKAAKEYRFHTYGEVAMRVRQLAAGFLSVELERGQRLAILAENQPEWAVTDLACQMCGLISVPLFASLPAGQIKTILADCGAGAIVVSDPAQRKKIAAIQAELPNLTQVWEIEAGDLKGLEEQGRQHLEQHSGLYETTWPAALADDVATIIYTSGTTGEPKGVMLTHRNIIADIEGVLAVAPHLGAEDVFLSFLPLAHVYERTAGHFLPLRLGASVAYAESLFTVDKNLAEVSPTVMTCVPRLLESSREKLFSAAKALPEGQQEKYLDALQLAQKAGMASAHYPGAPGLSLPEKLKFRLYDAAVYGKIRQKFGGRLKHFVCGGAPMAPELGALFIGLGLEVLEGYGLTETSPVIAVNLPFKPRLTTVGPPLPGVEVKIADDGEILARGGSIMKGYWNKPEASAAVLDAQGWFHTGDIGKLEGGLLSITDRKKDLLVLANGKNVAPQPIEISLQESRYVAQAVLLGDRQKAVTALIVPNFTLLHEWAKEANVPFESDADLIQKPEVQKLLRAEIDERTGSLADFEKVRKFVLLPEPLTIQNGELTPTLKVKRRVVAEKYGHLVE